MVYKDGGQEHQLPTACCLNWRFSASYDSEVVNQSSVLRLKFSGENRHLRKAANRYIMAAEGSQFLTRRIYEVDSLLAIDSTRKVELMRSFIHNCMNHKNLGFADNFDKAFSFTFNQISDTSYYAIVYNNDISKQTALATTTSMASYVKQDRLSAYTINEIAPLQLQ